MNRAFIRLYVNFSRATKRCSFQQSKQPDRLLSSTKRACLRWGFGFNLVGNQGTDQ
jgi:hypothetical protein